MEVIDNNTDLFEAAKKADERRKAIEQANNMQESIEYSKRQEAAKRKSKTQKKIEARKKERRKVFAKGFASGALAAVLLLSGIKEGKKLKEKIEYNDAVKEAAATLENDFKERAVENGLGIINENGRLDTFDAINLDGADPIVIHIAHNSLTPEDFDASIRTVHTSDNSGKYLSVEQWQRDIGAIDKNTGTTSYIEERKMYENTLYTISVNGNYNDILDTCEDLVRTDTPERGH